MNFLKIISCEVENVERQKTKEYNNNRFVKKKDLRLSMKMMFMIHTCEDLALNCD